MMDNHYHLLIQTPQGNLSRIMRHLGGVFTQRFNRKHQRDGPLFRGRFKAILVDADEYLLAVARYIHRNPVEAGLVKRPETYPWSSCGLYLNPRKAPKWLDVDLLLSHFSRTDFRREYLAYMRSKVEEEVESFYLMDKLKPILGSRDFLEEIGRRLRKGERDFRGVSGAREYLRVDWRKCLMEVGKFYDMNRRELMGSRRGRRNEARGMAMYLCRKHCGLSLEEISRVFRVKGSSTVSSVVGRIQADMDEGGKAADRYREIWTRLEKR